MQNKTIIFDFGNVIAKFDNQIFLTYLAGYTDKSPKELERRIYHESVTPRAFEHGLMRPEKFYESIKKLAKADISYNDFCSIHSSIFTPIPSTLELIRELKNKGHQIGLLSNTNELHYERGIKPLFELAKVKPDFESLSFKLFSMKPDKIIYQDALSKSLFPNPIYADDILEYVRAGESLGMKGVHYKNPKDLISDLKKFSVEI